MFIVTSDIVTLIANVTLVTLTIMRMPFLQSVTLSEKYWNKLYLIEVIKQTSMLTLSMGHSCATRVMPPDPRYWPIATSWKKMGMPQKNMATAYTSRKAPVKVTFFIWYISVRQFNFPCEEELKNANLPKSPGSDSLQNNTNSKFIFMIHANKQLS